MSFAISKRLTFFVFLMSLFTLPGLAQTAGTGTITGTIMDATGAAVEDAQVLITNTETGVPRAAVTNNTGGYTAPFLQSGRYEVSVSKEGFSKAERKNLVLTVGQVLTIDAVLSAGGVTTEIQVSSESPIIDTDKTEVSQTVTQRLISNLPVNGRNWSNFVLISPNVVQDGGSGLISFRGISGLYNQNYVDGANNNQMLFSEARGRASGAPYVYSVDSIKEFQTAISNYSVEFGQAVGGQVNAITKSGTNQTHGDLFYYLRYPTLNALDPQTKWSARYNTPNPDVAAFLLTQPIHQQQQFGGSIGGPILKDRLFYFFTYDGFRRVGKALYYNSNTITLTPTDGNSGGSVISPTQCPATISADQCASALNFIIANAFGAPTRYSHSDLFFPRLDWHINAKNDAFVNYNFSNYDSTYSYQGSLTFNGSSPSTNGPASYHERFLIAGLTTQVSSRSVNQVRFQYGRDLETMSANAPGPNVAMGVFSYGMPNGLPRAAEPDEHRIQLTDVFSTVHGRHAFKFGGDANLVHEVMINLFQGGGLYGYASGTPAQNFQSWVQDAFAGQPGDTDPNAGSHYYGFTQTIDTVHTAANTQGTDDFWMKMFDAFAEDSWKIRHNLIVTAGIRWDLQVTPSPGLVNHHFEPISSIYTSTIKNVNRFQPRLGLSWQPYQGTVLRAGYGLFSSLNQGSTYYAMRVENGVVQVTYNYGPTSGLKFPNVPFLPTGPSLAGALYPAGGAAPSIVAQDTPAVGAQTFHGLDPNFVPPLAHEAELGIEQQLPGRLSLSIGYVGTRGMRLPVFLDASLVGQTPHGAATYNVLDGSSDHNLIKQITVPVYLSTDRKVQSSNDLVDASGKPIPLQSINTGYSVANTWYNSMAVSVRRPFANGLELLVNYTWAKATDTGQVLGTGGTFYGGNFILDPNNVRGENGLSDLDVRNRFVGSFVYNPHLFQSNKWSKTIIDGFTFAGTLTASAGQPIAAAMYGTVYNGTPLLDANGAKTTNIVAQGGIFGGAMNNSSGAATTGRSPLIGRNSIIGPGFNNLDLRVSRDVPIHESMKLQFTVESFNLLNRRIISGVSSTYSQYNALSACPAGQTPGPDGAPLQGCIVPYAGTGASAFGAPSVTSNSLYGPRQLQVIGKLFF
ncbi:MAG: carboxypeptidase regulatory-like domain-containing protein [Acidobacteriaceae bacterium]|nr:carboxypeptidase regulatory-like domain-containing protein [Acidobacteriaceae bacterium]